MAHIFTTIPTLTHTPNPNNPHNFPPYLSLWEIMLNQRFTPEYVEEKKKEAGDMEELILDLLQTLYNNNGLYICDPLTGEILYHYNITTGEEYKEEGFALLPSAVQEEVAVC